ncbi:MAG: ATP phosphoribosyltransferase, partial [Leptospiraceae bacterium]|nr:ATP phosphoribosyltransferase [Leptospiraceae bacterium]
YFFNRGFNIEIIQLYGSIEIAPITGISDVITDLVSTGATLKANGLQEEEQIMHSTAHLILNRAAYVHKRQFLNEIIDALS